MINASNKREAKLRLGAKSSPDASQISLPVVPFLYRAGRRSALECFPSNGATAPVVDATVDEAVRRPPSACVAGSAGRDARGLD
jgi:hypothetical protein